jgi:hypothetical protein
MRNIRSLAFPLYTGVNVFLFNVGSVISAQTTQKFSEKSGYDDLEMYRRNRRRSTVELGYNVMKGVNILCR